MPSPAEFLAFGIITAHLKSVLAQRYPSKAWQIVQAVALCASWTVAIRAVATAILGSDEGLWPLWLILFVCMCYGVIAKRNWI